ncbi:hypothetical protein D3C78_1769120 [compost metagenome]
MCQHGGQAEYPGGHEDGVTDDAQCCHRQVMFTAQALGEDEGVLGTDGHDQAEGHQHAIEIALPHGRALQKGSRKMLAIVMFGAV